MPSRTDIEWTDFSSNPLKLRHATSKRLVNVCVKISEGCRNCYADTITGRFWRKAKPQQPARLEAGVPVSRRRVDRADRGEGKYPGYSLPLLKMGEFVTDDDELRHILRFQPRGPFRGGTARPKVFLTDMSDPFGDWWPFELIDRMFAAIACRPDVDFQLLTKRPDRMLVYLRRTGRSIDFLERPARELGRTLKFDIDGRAHGLVRWPLPNLALGVSVESQRYADERIPHLLDCDAAVRFISAEPLLGPIDLNKNLGGTRWIGGQRGCDGTHPGVGTPDCPRAPHHHHDERCRKGIDWVIAGGESGPGARPMHPDWPRELRNQCRAAGVPFFFKQWGSWKPICEMFEPEHVGLYRSKRKAKEGQDQAAIDEVYGRTCSVATGMIRYDGKFFPIGAVGGEGFQKVDGHVSYQTFRLDKKKAGHSLDGTIYREFPYAPATTTAAAKAAGRSYARA